MTLNLYSKTFRFVVAFFLLMLFFVMPAAAQGTGKSTVTLKSGEVVKGKIIEAIPDQYIRIELDDKSVKKINSSDISDIASDDEKKPARVGLSVIGGVESGYDVSTGLQYVVVEPRVIVGLKVNQNRVGLGLGFIFAHSLNYTAPDMGYYSNYISSTSAENLYYFPLYINYHGEFGKKKVLPSVDVSVGYPINVQKANVYYTYDDQTMSTTHNYEIVQRGLAYLDVSPGVSFKVSKKVLFNLAVNLKLLAFQEVNKDKETIDGVNSMYNSAGGQTLGTTTRPLFSCGLGLHIIY